jgi:uncharacterized protein
MNPVVWFEIPVTDLERAKNFYQAVFGIELNFVDFPGSPMYMMGSSDPVPGSGGALVQSADNKPGTQGSLVYFNSTDVAIEQAKIEPAGGKLILPKESIGEFGFICLFIDTEGNRVGIHSTN